MRDPVLWRRLDAFDLDGSGAGGSFAARLARRRGWTDAYAARVIEELRRFFYLAAVAEAEAKPSAPIEAAWAVLRAERPAAWAALAAGPLAGRAPRPAPPFASHYVPQDSQRYAATRALYAEEFGAAPPRNVWQTIRDKQACDHWTLALFFGVGIAAFSLALVLYGDIVPGVVGLAAGGALARLAGRRLDSLGPALAPLGAGRRRGAA